MEAAPARPLGQQVDRDLNDMLDDEPLALSPAQIVEDDTSAGGFSFESILADTEEEASAPTLVEAEDIAFDADEDDLPSFDPAPPRAPIVETAKVEPAPAPVAPPPQPRPAVAEAAPLPDPRLTSDLADELLEPATKAAVRTSIGKLNALGIGNPGLTLEAMMRDMLRPMLKEWLDENLPSVVE